MWSSYCHCRNNWLQEPSMLLMLDFLTCIGWKNMVMNRLQAVEVSEYFAFCHFVRKHSYDQLWGCTVAEGANAWSLASSYLTSEHQVTFRGIVATEKFLERPGVPDFLRAYFITTARVCSCVYCSLYCQCPGLSQANFYWKNNTKEFTLYYRGRYSVSAKVAAVIPNGVDTDVFTNMVDLEFPTLQEQVTHSTLQTVG